MTVLRWTPIAVLCALPNCLVFDVIRPQSIVTSETTEGPTGETGETGVTGETGPTGVSGPAPVTIANAPTATGVCINKTTTIVATVTGATNTSVTWTIDSTPAGASVSVAGVFLATIKGSYVVRATSQADATKSATTDVSVVDGCIEHLAGALGGTGMADDVGTDARFHNPFAVAMAADGTVYVVDQLAVRQVSPDGTTKIIAGSYSAYAYRSSGPALGATCGLRGIAAGPSGELYTLDGASCGTMYSIKKLTFDGTVWQMTTLAGGMAQGANDDPVGANARFNYPSGIAVSGTDLIVVDLGNNKLRRVAMADGATTSITGATDIATPVGNGFHGVTCANAGFANNAINAAVMNGHAYVTLGDPSTSVVDVDLACSGAGAVSVLSGEGIESSSDTTLVDGRFHLVAGIAALPGDQLIVTEPSGARLRILDLTGNTLTSVAGGEYWNRSVDGNAFDARFMYPFGVAAHPSQTFVAVADPTAATIRRFDLVSAEVTTLAGLAKNGDSVTDFEPNAVYPDTTRLAGLLSRIGDVESMAAQNGILYMSESSDSPLREGLRRFDLLTGEMLSSVDFAPGGPGSAWEVNVVAAAPNGHLWIAGTVNGDSWLREVDGQGTVYKIVAENLAGNSDVTNLLPSGSPATYTSASLGIYSVTDIAVAADGTLYVADFLDMRVRQFVFGASGELTTKTSGTGGNGCSSGAASTATYRYPGRLALSGTTLFVSEMGNHTIARIDLNPANFLASTVSRVAGFCQSTGVRVDGTATAARFADELDAIALDSTGTLYIADGNAVRVLRNAVSGVGMTVATVAGKLDYAYGVRIDPAPQRLNRVVALTVYADKPYFVSESALLRLP